MMAASACAGSIFDRVQALPGSLLVLFCVLRFLLFVLLVFVLIFSGIASGPEVRFSAATPVLNRLINS